VRRVAVLQPEDLRRDVGRHVLLVRHLGDVAVLVAEDLDSVVAVADGAPVTVATSSKTRRQKKRYSPPSSADC
jgi:hypothetical protein